MTAMMEHNAVQAGRFVAPVADDAVIVDGWIVVDAAALPVAPRMIDWRADSIVPGVYLSNRHQVDTDRAQLLAPLMVVAVAEDVDCDGDPLLWFTLDNGWRMPFEPDFVCEVQCVPLPCPPWCVTDDFDRHDGTVRHGSAEEIVLFRDETGKEHEVYAAVSRWDDPDGTIAEGTSVSIVCDNTNGFDITATAARELGEMLARVAGYAEVGTTVVDLVDVEYIRLADEILVADEWQAVTLLVHDGRRGEVSVYTVDEENAAICEPLGTPVEVRRTTSGKTTATAAGSPAPDTQEVAR